MFEIPDDEKAIKSQISRYRAAMRKEKANYGSINDGYGKRYLLFSLLLVLNDLEKSSEYISWYFNEFPDDAGEPVQLLCLTVLLFRLNREKEAKYQLGYLMKSKLYIIPHILGLAVNKEKIWHSSNQAEPDYADYIPERVLSSITPTEMDWIKEKYESFEFKRIRQRFIEIWTRLDGEKDLTVRKGLVAESSSLLDIFL